MSPASYGWPFFENCASDAGYFLNSGIIDASDRARPCETSKPSRASLIDGATSSFHGFEPASFHARCSPATVPGTPTDMWLL